MTPEPGPADFNSRQIRDLLKLLVQVGHTSEDILRSICDNNTNNNDTGNNNTSRTAIRSNSDSATRESVPPTQRYPKFHISPPPEKDHDSEPSEFFANHVNRSCFNSNLATTDFVNKLKVLLEEANSHANGCAVGRGFGEFQKKDSSEDNFMLNSIPAHISK